VPLLPLEFQEFRRCQLSPIRLCVPANYCIRRNASTKKTLLSRTAFHPHNLLFCNSNLSTLTLCNPNVISLHVPTNSQHVSLIMLSKSDHVATVVVIVNLLVGVEELVLRIQCPYPQWNEGFECSLPQHSNFVKEDWQDSIKPGIS
jgi:hypothetical protein